MADEDTQDPGDEVRRKPPKAESLPEEPTEEEYDSGYYDILLVGKTGMGKSSTADKIMVVNKPAVPEQEKPATPVIERGSTRTRQDAKPTKKAKKKKKKAKKLDEMDDTHREKVQYENITGWIISEDPQEQQYFDTRIKNIVFCRQTCEETPPHKSIDDLRKDNDYNDSIYRSSRSCQLLINEDSKIQVLDAPGFDSPELMKGASNKTDSNLAIVRHIVRIQALAGLKFKRVLYFLPQCGPLRRADRAMQEEIQEMTKFFGVSIFKKMVLVGTAQKGITEATDLPRERKFSPQDLEKSRNFFYEALVREFKEKGKDMPQQDLPKPPIIFIAQTDTCEEILDMITSADISNDGLQLEFNTNTCFRCGIETGMNEEDNTVMAEYRGPGAAPWVDAVPYKDTLCHPLLQSEYTLKSVVRGLVKMLIFKWKFSEELCVSCKKKPGSKGCIKVAQIYEEEGYDPITVDHTYKIDKPRVRKIVKMPETETTTAVTIQ